MSVNLIIICAALTAGMVQSCSKGTVPVTAVPYADTTKMLTANKWMVSHFWYDMNNNGRVDPGEIINGLDFINVYSFGNNGTLTDSTAAYLYITGSWSFKAGAHNAIFCQWSNSNTDLYYILGITDSTLTTKRWGTDQTWYFVRH